MTYRGVLSGLRVAAIYSVIVIMVTILSKSGTPRVPAAEDPTITGFSDPVSESSRTSTVAARDGVTHGRDWDKQNLSGQVEQRMRLEGSKVAGTEESDLRDNDYGSVPGTLEIFRDGGIICPNQTIDSLLFGGLYSLSPEEWGRRKIAVRCTGTEANLEIPSTRSEGAPHGLIVFKRGGSGSTWFDSLLRSHRSIDFRHEANKSVVNGRSSTSTKTKHLYQFLKNQGLCRSRSGHCGFSINPFQVPWVNWAELLKVTRASLVVFVRTNVVKRRLGLVRKELVTRLPQHCRTDYNLAANHSDKTCLVEKSTFIKMKKLKCLEEDARHQSWELLQVALDAGLPFQVLAYEAMQRNITRTFEQLGKFTGWEPIQTNDWASQQATTDKLTSEDLREAIGNYNEVESLLEKWGKGCFLDMLHSDEKQLFPLCQLPMKYMKGMQHSNISKSCDGPGAR